MTLAEKKLAAAHQALGEFVVSFQWIEDRYRQIGWFILDPNREQWPPKQLRKESNGQLIDKVTDMVVALTQQYALPGGDEKAATMRALRERFHGLRQYRNRLLHSTYIELKGGEEIQGYIRSDPRVGVDPETGEVILEHEDFSASSIRTILRQYADDIMHLGLIYTQVIHWAPFSGHGSR